MIVGSGQLPLLKGIVVLVRLYLANLSRCRGVSKQWGFKQWPFWGCPSCPIILIPSRIDMSRLNSHWLVGWSYGGVRKSWGIHSRHHGYFNTKTTRWGPQDS